MIHLMQKILAAKEEIKTLAAKAELKAEQDKIANTQTFDLSHFFDNSHFEDDGSQDYLVF